MRPSAPRLLVVLSLVGASCRATTAAPPTPAPGRALVRLFIGALDDGTQVYEHSLDASPPARYRTAAGRQELVAGSFYASSRAEPGMVPVYRFEIAASDGTPVYYLSTNGDAPPSFSNRRVQFYAWSSAGEGTAPVYLYTLRARDQTQVYYYATSPQTPPSFEAHGPVFHVFAERPPVERAAAEPASASVATSPQSECHPSTNPCAGGLRCCDMANLGGINDPVAHPPRYQCMGGSSCPAPLP